jgi:hypothetical protein
VVPRTRFVLYLEGPADRGILRGWSYRLLPTVARQLFGDCVLLGGRRPARAIEHFRGLGGAAAGARALCVLDRDGGAEAQLASPEPGLDLFTWSRRHIESYLLVPDAIRRALARRDDASRVDRLLRRHLPNGADEEVYRAVDAKRLLGPGGLLPRALGQRIDLSRVARATRETELHGDVHALFARLREELKRLGRTT